MRELRIKLVLKQILLGLFLLAVAAGLPDHPVAAEEVESWVVRSEYQSPIPGRGKSTIWWRFEPRHLLSGETQVLVTDLNARVEARVELYYDQENSLHQVDCYRYRRGEEICDARIYDVVSPVIMNQTMIPGDWLNRRLPFVDQEKVGEYFVKEKIGVTGFSSHFLVAEKGIGLAEAQSLGMISSDNELFMQDQRLRLVTVSKVMGSREDLTLIMRQLWAVGDNFWLYEEKGGRRSWRYDRQ